MKVFFIISLLFLSACGPLMEQAVSPYVRFVHEYQERIDPSPKYQLICDGPLPGFSGYTIVAKKIKFDNYNFLDIQLLYKEYLLYSSISLERSSRIHIFGSGVWKININQKRNAKLYYLKKERFSFSKFIIDDKYLNDLKNNYQDISNEKSLYPERKQLIEQIFWKSLVSDIKEEISIDGSYDNSYLIDEIIQLYEDNERIKDDDLPRVFVLSCREFE